MKRRLFNRKLKPNWLQFSANLKHIKVTIQALKDHSYVIEVWQVVQQLVSYISGCEDNKKHFKQICFLETTIQAKEEKFSRHWTARWVRSFSLFFLKKKNRDYGTSVHLFKAGCGDGRSALVRRPSQTLILESVVGRQLLLWHKTISFTKRLWEDNAASRCL